MALNNAIQLKLSNIMSKLIIKIKKMLKSCHGRPLEK